MSPFLLFALAAGLVFFVSRALARRARSETVNRDKPAIFQPEASIPNAGPHAPARGARWAVVLVSIVYLASFFLPALEFGSKGGSDFNLHPRGIVPGGIAFILGLGHLFEFGLSWLANPIFAVGILRMSYRHYPSATLAGFSAALVALSALVQDGLFGRGGDKVLNFLPGYWLWLTSMFGLAVAALGLLTCRHFRKDQTKNGDLGVSDA